jgi:hypothetical protein
MKFSLLPIGQTFQIDDHTYTKISALVAEQHATRQRKLIRRAAEVDVAQAETPAPSHAQRLLPEALVRQALDAYEDSLSQHGQAAPTLAAMEKARQVFLNHLETATDATP